MSENAQTGITLDDIRRTAQEVAAEVQAELYGSTNTSAGASKPYSTPPINDHDLSLAVEVLMIDQNLSREEASKAVVATGDLSPLRERIDARRAVKQSRADDQARRAWEASPEGRKAAAAEALKAQAERTALVQGARALLNQNAEEYGITPEMAAELNDDEALRVSGIEPGERDNFYDGADDLAANQRAADQRPAGFLANPTETQEGTTQ